MIHDPLLRKPAPIHPTIYLSLNTDGDLSNIWHEYATSGRISVQYGKNEMDRVYVKGMEEIHYLASQYPINADEAYISETHWVPDEMGNPDFLVVVAFAPQLEDYHTK